METLIAVSLGLNLCCMGWIVALVVRVKKLERMLDDQCKERYDEQPQ